MYKIELINEEWEEKVRYYYSEKHNTSLVSFTKKILTEEGISLTGVKELYITCKIDDFDNFIKKANIGDEKIVKIQSIEDDWDFKIYLIESVNYFILRIWETTA